MDREKNNEWILSSPPPLPSSPFFAYPFSSSPHVCSPLEEGEGGGGGEWLARSPRL